MLNYYYILLYVTVLKNDIETLFFWKQALKSGCTLYGKYGIQLYFKESEGIVVEFV